MVKNAQKREGSQNKMCGAIQYKPNRHLTEGVCLWQHVQCWSHARTRDQYNPSVTFLLQKNLWKRMFFKVFCQEKRFFQEVQEIQIFHKEIELGALAHCNVSLSLHQKARSPRVWSDRACGAVRLKNESVCHWRDAPLHPLMKCASPIQ